MLVESSLLLTLAMLEGAARWLHLGSGGFREPDPNFGWRNFPHARGWESCYGECEVYVEINALGLRDYDYDYQKPPGTQRILFLGDSMTAGMQVPLDGTSVKLLQRGLAFIREDPARYLLRSLSRIPVYFRFWPSSQSGMLSNIARTASFGLFLPLIIWGI